MSQYRYPQLQRAQTAPAIIPGGGPPPTGLFSHNSPTSKTVTKTRTRLLQIILEFLNSLLVSHLLDNLIRLPFHLRNLMAHTPSSTRNNKICLFLNIHKFHLIQWDRHS